MVNGELSIVERFTIHNSQFTSLHDLCGSRYLVRIGFDARMIDHPGIGTYIKCLLSAMLKEASDLEFLLYGDPDKLSHFSVMKNCHIRTYKAPIYGLNELLLSPFTGDDLVHIPHFNAPLFVGSKTVVTIHDLIYLKFPEKYANFFKLKAVELAIGNAVKKASKIIAVSENTKKDIIERFPETAGKIKVIYEAASDRYKRVFSSEKLDEIRKKFGINGRIVLYVGSIKPHKNILTLVKVFRKLKEWGVPHQLVLVGRWDNKEDYLKNKLSDDYVRYIGEVSADDLGGLYSLADVLVNLSLYEGFGLTLLEAMQCGVPVVTSNVSSIPEVVGNAAYTLAPGAVEQIADTVYNVLANKELREGMIKAGYQQAAGFSWEKTAKETLKVYRSVVN